MQASDWRTVFASVWRALITPTLQPFGVNRVYYDGLRIVMQLRATCKFFYELPAFIDLQDSRAILSVSGALDREFLRKVTHFRSVHFTDCTSIRFDDAFFALRLPKVAVHSAVFTKEIFVWGQSHTLDNPVWRQIRGDFW